jgi:endonuclease/exonuclease/phosphatase family metal-dependent hydrolase
VPTVRLLSLDAQAAGRDRAAPASVISEADADVVCLHNAPHLLRWRSRTGAVARRAGLVVVGAGGRESGANALLSTLGVDSAATRNVRLTTSGGLRPAGAVIGLLRRSGADVVVASTTLVGNAAERLGQARRLQDAIERLVPDSPPVVISVLGADRPGTAAWQCLAENRVAVGGRVFVDERIAVAEAREITGGRPTVPAVLAVLELGAGD